MNNGDDKNRRENAPGGEIHYGQDEKDDRAQKIALTGFGVRVEIIDHNVSGKVKCRRLQDGTEIMVPAEELMFVPQSTPEDQPRQLFQHTARWRDPGE